ncbi:winged helix DNA-binding protein [Magnetovibrio sp. PR-2]|uniref:winged helix DNA-binding protein n=1 Tax=Magnetovibrio sp. PR-2 TaxID=3120356 RepID=UPI002FCE5C2B
MSKHTPIVSSAHLAQPGAEGVSEFEYGLIVMSGAFERWTVRCMAAAGLSELSHLDVLVLHSVNHRDRDKRATDICFVLGIEDTHTVTYALKKLVKLELVERHKRGKESFFTASTTGRAACETYREVREACLLESLERLGLSEAEFQDVGSRLRTLSGLYDQAARAAASL